LIADPDLPNKMMNGDDDDIARCGACMQGCLVKVKSGEGLACIINPEVGREEDLTPRAKHPRKVVVVGGGPAGMQAAVTAQSRGHRVTLLDDGELGGQFNLAVIPPGKSEMKKPLAAIVSRVRKSDITLRLGVHATVGDILDENPEHVILATGSVPNKPEIKGLDGMLSSADVLLEKREVGRRVLVIGGGMVGLETAEFLAERGRSVTVVEILADVAADMEPITKKLLLKSLAELGVTVLTGTAVNRFEERKAFIEGANGEIQLGEFDSVVSAVGVSPMDELGRALKARGINVYRIGDAKSPGSIIDAVTGGYEIGKRIQ
jgi:NADPH-dependent 2,4-dienoyl-CoA reductase/sulfur reductase-like enzyme